jgi:hypothetical protein
LVRGSLKIYAFEDEVHNVGVLDVEMVKITFKELVKVVYVVV